MTGKFIVIEGTDGSGKATQTAALAAWLSEQGRSVAVFDFPRYGQPSAHFVEQYLAGAYGPLPDVPPRLASLFYALDRFAAASEISAALAAGTTVLCNRYVASNLAHQGAKITGPAEREAFFRWDAELEFGTLGLPRPSHNLVLLMPALQAQALARQRGSGELPLHEADLPALEAAERTYRELCHLFPQFFIPVDCAPHGHPRSISAIQADVRQLVSAVIA